MTFLDWWNNDDLEDFAMYWNAIPGGFTDPTGAMQVACRDAWLAGRQQLRKQLAIQLREEARFTADPEAI